MKPAPLTVRIIWTVGKGPDAVRKCADVSIDQVPGVVETLLDAADLRDVDRVVEIVEDWKRRKTKP